MPDPITILIPVYEGVTQLDFTGPHQFLVRVPSARVIVASVGAKAIACEGLVFAGLTDLSAVLSCDVLCVPGGAGCIDALEDDAYLASIRRLAGTAKYLTSVCTGSLILAAAGLLEGRRAACHWAWRDLLSIFGAIPDAARVVRDANIITGGGVTAGIDLALTLIAELAGEELARSIQLRLEYAPAPPFDSGRPESASPETLQAVSELLAPDMAVRRTRLEALVKPRPRSF
ncbi:MAG: DJ-1/PfpI family protein [Polyangiaceae bacterium]